MIIVVNLNTYSKICIYYFILNLLMTIYSSIFILDFQNLVLTLLNKIKYEISNLSSKINIQQSTINAFDNF